MTPTPKPLHGAMPELPPFSQLIGHMLRYYVPSSVELQVAVAIRAYATAYARAAVEQAAVAVPEGVLAWQAREMLDEDWSEWREYRGQDLERWRVRVSRRPDLYQLRPLYAAPSSPVQPDSGGLGARQKPLDEGSIAVFASRAFTDYMTDATNDQDVAFARYIEAAHGINPDSGNPVSATREDGHADKA